MTHRFVSTNFRVVLNVTFNILSPNNGVVVFRFKKLINVLGPRFNSLDPFKDDRHIFLDGKNSNSSKVVAKDTKRRDCLSTRVRVSKGQRWVITHWVVYRIVVPNLRGE